MLIFRVIFRAIEQNASQWLLLNTIACVIGVCLLILGLIVCIVLIIMHLVMPINNENSPTLGPTYVLIFLVICPSIGLVSKIINCSIFLFEMFKSKVYAISVIGWHFTAVIYTLYCQIKEENRHHLVVAYKADRKDTKRSTVEYEI